MHGVQTHTDIGTDRHGSTIQVFMLVCLTKDLFTLQLCCAVLHCDMQRYILQHYVAICSVAYRYEILIVLNIRESLKTCMKSTMIKYYCCRLQLAVLAFYENDGKIKAFLDSSHHSKL